MKRLQHSRSRFTAHVLAISASAFALHFAWESIQCPLFFIHGSYNATWLGMVVASLGDVVITWTIYSVVAIAGWRWRWARQPSRQRAVFQSLIMIMTAVAIATVIEMRALSSESWAYNDSMPIVPALNVAWVPLLQLVILTPIVVALGEHLTRIHHPILPRDTAPPPPNR